MVSEGGKAALSANFREPDDDIRQFIVGEQFAPLPASNYAQYSLVQ